MNRRELLTGAAAMVAAVGAGRAFAADEHDHMNMGKSDGAHSHHKTNRNQRLIDAASDCVLKAEVCLQHCIVAMGAGESDLADCARSSSQVAAISAALQQLASGESKHLPKLAQAAMDVLKDCEEECKKTEKHPECKDCGESCVVLYKECKKIST